MVKRPAFVLAGVLLALSTLVGPAAAARSRTASPAIVPTTFYMTGVTQDQVNKEDAWAEGIHPAAGSLTFTSTQPTAADAILQTTQLSGNPDFVPNNLGAYWVGPFSGDVSGTVDVTLYMSTINPENVLLDAPVAVQVFADPDYFNYVGTKLGSIGEDGNLSVPVGPTPQPVTFHIPVSGTVTSEVLIQVIGTFTDAGNGINFSYGSTTALSQFTLPVVPPPSMSINDVSLSEGSTGATPFSFVASLSAPSTRTVSASWSTADGTATAGSDYTAASGTVTFPPGTTAQPVVVQVTGDTAVEANETFLVNLSAPVNATLGDGQGQGTIVNEDFPKMSIGDVSQAEGNSGSSDFTFQVSLSTSSPQAISAHWATADGTSGAGSDYAAASGTVSLPAGTTTQTVTVQVNGDTDLEPDETFFVNLSSPVNATIDDGHAQGTITNDDVNPDADLSVTNVAAPSPVTADSTLEYTVTVSNAGPAAATNASLQDDLPSGVIFGSATPSQGTCSGTAPLVCALGTIASGSQATVTVDITPIAPGKLTSTATVGADQPDANANNSAPALTTVKAQPKTVYVSVGDGGFSRAATMTQQGYTVQWNFTGTVPNGVQDNSGMGLFDSGSQAPVSYYRFRFISAGIYKVADALGHASSVKVALKAAPHTGTTTKTFTITWASAAPPAGYVYDTQISRPGAGFVDWKTAQSTRMAHFVPDAGTGTYRFRARLRNTSNGKASDYSGAKSITVS